MVDLGSHLPAWRTNAQEELIKRGHPTLDFLQNNLVKNSQNKSLETWTAWTIGRIKKGHELSEKNLNQKSNPLESKLTMESSILILKNI